MRALEQSSWTSSMVTWDFVSSCPKTSSRSCQCLKTWVPKLVHCLLLSPYSVGQNHKISRHCGEDLDPTLNDKRVWVSVQECMAIFNLSQNYFIRFSLKSGLSTHCNFVKFIDESVIYILVIFSQLSMAI